MSERFLSEGIRSVTHTKSYVLGILTLVNTLNYLDRCLVALLLQPIKVSLQLTDTQLGFVTGIAFGLFYAVLGIPIAKWADRGNRVVLTSAALGLWAVTVMSGAWVRNFAQLAMARVAAAVGEAGCVPPTYSLVGDYFPQPAERTRAMAFYMMASPLSALLSFAVGGWLNEHYGWRETFFWVGLPGLLVAAVVLLTVRETRRPNEGPALPRIRTVDVLVALWQRRSLRHLTFGLTLLLTMGFGLAPWYAAFMMRSHGMQTAELGVDLGLIFGVAGVAGVAAGGYIVGRWYADRETQQLRLIAALIATLTPFFGAFLLVPGKVESLLALAPIAIVCNCLLGPVFALLQRLVPAEMRATTMAVVMLFANLVGMGVGPEIVGVLSDSWAPTLGSNSLRYAMLTVSTVSLWAAIHFCMAGRYIVEDLATVNGLRIAVV